MRDPLQVDLSLAWLRWLHSPVSRQHVGQRGVVVPVGVRRHLLVELLNLRVEGSQAGVIHEHLVAHVDRCDNVR
eukprot:10421754-Alexandrium_andersonii.AAC.1